MKKILTLLVVACCCVEASVLFGVTRDSGTLNEIDASTGAILSQVAGISNASGLSFNQAGQLFVTINNNSGSDSVVKVSNNGQITNFVDFGSSSVNPWDVSFDSSGNVYVVTDTQVQKYSASGNLQLAFNHDMVGTRSFVVNRKELGLSVNPVTGDIVVAGRNGGLDASARVFN